MQIELINQYHGENMTQFKITDMKRQWDILLLVVSGCYLILPEGRKKPIRLREHEIAFLPAGTHFLRELEEPTTYYHISFRADAEHPFRLSLPSCKLALPPEQTASIFKSMSHAFLIPNNRELITHIVEHIFVENYLFGKTNRVSFRPLSEEVLSTVRYMNQNLSQSIDMDVLAARVYLSHSGLIWKFKHELGTTPSQYLILLRMQQAKQLLLNHSYTVAEIAEQCGYENPYYFTNAFHRYSGMSPTQFRRHYLGEHSTP